jgi:hypothetical protein
MGFANPSFWPRMPMASNPRSHEPAWHRACSKMLPPAWAPPLKKVAGIAKARWIA